MCETRGEGEGRRTEKEGGGGRRERKRSITLLGRLRTCINSMIAADLILRLSDGTPADINQTVSLVNTKRLLALLAI